MSALRLSATKVSSGIARSGGAAPLALLAVLALVLVACGASHSDDPAPSSSAAAGPARIVVLGPSLTETVFAVGAGAQVVAVDKLSDFPAQAPRTALDSYTPNAEAIAAYHPDLVIATDDRNSLGAALRALHIRVEFFPATTTVEATYEQVAAVGAAVGHAVAGQDLARQMRTDIGKIVADTPRRNLSYYHELGEGYSVGPHTFIGSVYALFGLQNVAADAARGNDYPQVSAEYVVQHNPDLIFFAEDSGSTVASISGRPGWSAVTAVAAHHIFPLNADIASRWGPRVVDLVRAIADDLDTVT